MKRVNFLSANLYSHGKMKLNCVKICNNETKLNEGGKKNVYLSVITCTFVSRSLFV